MSRWFEQLVDQGGSPRTLRVIASVLLVLLLALASLQYHWIGQLSEAKKTEMEQALRGSSMRFAGEVNRELGRAYGFLMMGRAGMESDGIERFAERYRLWSSATTHPKLIKRLIVVQGDKAQQLDFENLDFAAAAIPAEWAPLTAELQKIAERGPRGFIGGGGGPLRGGGGDRDRDHDRERGERGGGPPRMAGGVSESLPILIGPRFERNSEGEPKLVGWVLAELDLDYLKSELLPEVSQRHFGDNYQIRITNRADPDAPPIFQTANSSNFTLPDLEIGMFEVNWQDASRFGGMRRFGGPNRNRAEAGPGSQIGSGGPPPPPPGLGGPGGPGSQGRWLLQVKHPSGSLDAAVQTLRYKNLGISTAILLLMGIAIGAFVNSTRRAQQLALQQMEFVASISHELRTPLTVICSAGDNLAGGVVKNDTQVKRYGNLIRSEGHRLADMVEQILGYAGIQKGRLPAPQPVDVAGIVEGAVRACSQLIESRGCTVETHIDPELPNVSGDAASLSHCVQNLITNAAKYGGDWIGIRAELADNDKRILITVEDHGPGIEAKELRHIFEPFFRGKKAVDDQIHGTGLGLSLVKRIVEAHSGRVSVDSAIGRGTRFTLELPAMAKEAEPVSV
jgi:signal transduction histidine kinase